MSPSYLALQCLLLGGYYSSGARAISLPWYSDLLQQSGQATLAASNAHPYYVFERPIKKVAVIGAGASGLQYTAILRDHGFDVRLFESKSHPGGNWYYQEDAPLQEVYPQPPPSRAAFDPDHLVHPRTFPYTKIYEEGDGGLSLKERLLEQGVPSSIWDSLHTNSASGITHFIDSPLSPGAPWELSQRVIQRHVRAYASQHELNIGDGDVNNVTSYNTRVELVEKLKGELGESLGWRLTLKKLDFLPRARQIEATWWTEEFDAVVVASGTNSSPRVPNIRGLGKWAKTYPSNVYHSRHYRRPQNYANTTVLIIGASISGSEIARDLFPHAAKVITSVKDDSKNRTIGRQLAFNRIPQGVINLSEIGEFETPKHGQPIAEGRVHLKNGTILTGIDSVIVATGYVTSFPFLPAYHNDTIIPTDENPELDTEIAPIVLGDGKQLRSLYLGTFYIDDPTLVVAAVRVWNIGSFAATAAARVWSGHARLPNRDQLWDEYHRLAHAAGGLGRPGLVGVGFGAPITEYLFRKFVGWINSEANILGGAQIDTYPREWREQWVHFAKVHWGPTFPVSLQDFLDADEAGDPGLSKRSLIAEVAEHLEDY